MSIFYGIVWLLSVLLLVAYFVINKKRDKWLMFLLISIFVCNSGYLLLSLSKTLTIALISNSIAYIGNVFLPLFMLMLIFDACKIKYSKTLIYILISVGIIILFIATSGGYLPIYYKSVSLEFINGSAKLIKEYGILHNLYFVYLFAYMASMIAILIYSIIKRKIVSKMHASFLCVIVFGNILVWIIEQFIPHNFEFLCVSYVLNECLLLFLYGMLNEYEKIRSSTTNVDLSVLDCKGGFSQEQVAIIFTKWNKIGDLTNREKEILKHILFGEKRKEIASKLYVTDSAVKKHTSNIFKKLCVESRVELYDNASKILAN